MVLLFLWGGYSQGQYMHLTPKFSEDQYPRVHLYCSAVHLPLYPKILDYTTEHMHLTPTSLSTPPPLRVSTCAHVLPKSTFPTFPTRLTPIMEWLHRLRTARSSPWLGTLPPGWDFNLHKKSFEKGRKYHLVEIQIGFCTKTFWKKTKSYQQRDLQRSTSHCWPPEDLPSAILDRQMWRWKELSGQLRWTWTWKGFWIAHNKAVQ